MWEIKNYGKEVTGFSIIRKKAGQKLDTPRRWTQHYKFSIRRGEEKYKFSVRRAEEKYQFSIVQRGGENYKWIELHDKTRRKAVSRKNLHINAKPAKVIKKSRSSRVINATNGTTSIAWE